MILLPIILVLSHVFTFGNCLKILLVFPHEGKSHLYIFAPIVKGLVDRGHELLVITHHSFNLQGRGYREIVLQDPLRAGEQTVSLNKPGASFKLNETKCFSYLLDKGLLSCELMLSNKDVQELIKSGSGIDLIIAENFNSECFQLFVNKFKVPFVGLLSTTLLPWSSGIMGNPDNPSYIPTPFLWHGNKMGFLDRVENFVWDLYEKSFYQLCLGENQKLLEKYFERNIASLAETRKNTSLLLVNSHFSLTFPRPLVPGIIEIGGIHISRARKLPGNIEKFINESTHGVIYFSLGSMIKGHTFPEEKRQEFLKAFARLPQRVLWKWENETMPGKPDNIMIQKWMPQFDILSHPNVKAFISHAGLLGTTEAVHCGVPMLLMPQYGDQHTNARAVEANGGGIVLYLKDVTEEKVYESLKTLMSPEFTAKTKALSERFRDRPMSPMDTAIYWIEYVARHKGAPHLKTAAVDMPLYQYLLLDVIGFLALIFLAFSYIVYKIIRLIYRAIFSKNKVKKN